MKKASLLLPLLLLFSSASVCFAQEQAFLYSGFEPLEQSKAYTTLKRRGVTDVTVLHYLIDRYAKSKIKIVYDEHKVDAFFAANFARLFLLKQYRKETPEEWILKYCNTSIFSGKAIWVELPDKSLRLSREILFEELEVLSSTLAKDNIDWEPPKKA